MKMIIKNLKRLVKEEAAASLLEYVIVIGAGVVLAAALTPQLQQIFTTAVSSVGTQVQSFITQ